MDKKAKEQFNNAIYQYVRLTSQHIAQQEAEKKAALQMQPDLVGLLEETDLCNALTKNAAVEKLNTLTGALEFLKEAANRLKGLREGIGVPVKSASASDDKPSNTFMKSEGNRFLYENLL